MSEFGPDKLPKGWNWVTLREISDIAGGVTKGQKRRLNQPTRMVPYLRVANVQRGYLDLTEVKEIEASEPEIDSLRLQPGDILFNEGGDRDKLGRGWIWNGELPECVHQNHVFRARLRTVGNHPKFISYYSNSIGQNFFIKHGKQTTNLASINLTKLGSLPIPLPPPEEQRRIVAEIEKQFTRLEAGVAALRRVQANLKRYRAAVLKAACEGRLVPTEAELAKTGKQKAAFETGEALLARILKERRKNGRGRGSFVEPADPNPVGLPDLPNGWAWATLEQLCPLFVDSAHRTPRYGHEGIPALGPRDVVGGRLNLKKARYVSEFEFAIQTQRHVPQPGDIVYSRELSLGWGVAVPESQRLCMSQGMCLFRPNEAVNLHFFIQMLNGPVGRKHAENAAVGSAHPHINLGDIKAYVFPLPPSSEQLRIVEELERRLSVVEELEAMVTVNLQRATRLRQSILQKAFTGELL